MGLMSAMSMAEAVSDNEVGLEGALVMHLRSNHYPPLPLDYVEVAMEVIAILTEDPEDFEVEVTLPPSVNPIPRQAFVDEDGALVCQAGILANILHLGAFLSEEF